MKKVTITRPGRLLVKSLVIGALFFAGTSAPQFAPKAEAQVTIPVILVIDRATILAESEAGKNISEQAKPLLETIQKELEGDFEGLKKEEEQLIAQQTLLAPEVLRERAEKLQVKRRDFEVTTQIKNREYQASIAQATSEIGKVLEPILADLIRERSATMLIDRAEVMFATPDIDITAEAMKRLNDKLTEVKLERVKIDANGQPVVKEEEAPKADE